MKKIVVSFLTMALLMGTMATTAFATELETVQEGIFTITNVADVEQYSDGTSDYICAGSSTITINEDVEWISLYYYDYTSYSWESLYFNWTYEGAPIFDTTNLPVNVWDLTADEDLDAAEAEEYTMEDFLADLSDGTVDTSSIIYEIPAGSSFDVCATLAYNIVAWYTDGTYEECYLVVEDVAVTEEEVEVAEEEAEVVTGTATATASTVLVDGEEVAFEAYNIADNNYFKLRDIAAILSGTEAQFEVTWDGDLQAIDLITGEAYTEVGGELAVGDGSAKAYSSTTATIYLNGEEVALTAYNIADNNYFKLRDLGEAIGFNVSWDSEAGAIVIASDEAYIAD